MAAKILVRAAALLVLSACGDSSTGLKVGPPAALLILSGQRQTAVVGTELPEPLHIRVVDAEGNPVAGQIVNFKVTSGGGSAFAGVSITAENGEARERWTLGTSTSLPQRLEARAIDPNTGEALVFGVFEADAKPDVVAAISKAGGDLQNAPAGQPAADSLSVLVADRYGNPVPGANVAWAVSAGGAAISPVTSTTSSAGIAKTQLTAGTTVGITETVTATVSGIAPAAFNTTVRAASATQIVLAQPARGAFSGRHFDYPPVVRLLDAFGNYASNASDAVTLSASTGGTLVGTATVNAVNGDATFADAGLSGLVGSYTLTFTAMLGGVTRTINQSIALSPGDAFKTALVIAPTTVASGELTTPAAVVEVQDAAGNASPYSSLQIVVDQEPGTGPGTLVFYPSSENSDANGRATFTNLRISGPVGSGYVIRFGYRYGTLGNYLHLSPLTVTAGPPTRLRLMNAPSASASNGVPLAVQPVFQIFDASGNPVRQAGISVHIIVPDYYTVSGGTVLSDSNGVVTFTGLAFTGPSQRLLVIGAYDGLSADNGYQNEWWLTLN